MAARVEFNHDGLRAKVAGAVRMALDDSVLVIQREMVKELSKPGKGKLYKRSEGYGNRRNLREQGFHRASRPGDPPAADTGTLRRSWQAGTAGRAEVDRSRLADKLRPRIRVGSKVFYARYMEYGTSRIARRPYVDRPVKRAVSSGQIAKRFTYRLGAVFSK